MRSAEQLTPRDVVSRELRGAYRWERLDRENELAGRVTVTPALRWQQRGRGGDARNRGDPTRHGFEKMIRNSFRLAQNKDGCKG